MIWSLTVMIRKVSVKWLKILLAQKIYSFTCQDYHVNDFHESRLSSNCQDYASFLHLFEEACWNDFLLSFSPFSWRIHISQLDSHASTLVQSCDRFASWRCENWGWVGNTEERFGGWSALGFYNDPPINPSDHCRLNRFSSNLGLGSVGWEWL